MHTTLKRVALALALSLPMTAAAVAEPPAPGELVVVSPGSIICTDRDAMVALAVTPDGPEWTELMAGYSASQTCGRVGVPVVAMAGEAIDAGVDDGNGYHWYALEVVGDGTVPAWLLWGEPDASVVVPPERQLYEPSGWPIYRPDGGWQA